MKQTKLYLAFHSVAKEEWKSLGKYIIMETSDKSDVYNLFTFIKSKTQQSVELATKDEVRIELFPLMSEKSFLNLCSRLFIIFEEWLIWIDTKNNKNDCAVRLVKIYNRRGIFKFAEQKFNRINRILLKEETSNLNTNKLLSELYHYHYFSENNTKDKHPNLILDLIKSHKLRYKEMSLIYLAQMTLLKSYKLDDYSDKIQSFENSLLEIEDSNTSTITRKIYNLVKDEDINSLDFIYKKLVEKKISSGSDLEVFSTLFGTSISQTLWTKNILKSPDRVLSFYQYGLDSGVLLRLGKISTYRFTQITTMLTNTQNVKICYQFIDKYSGLLEDKDRESTTALSIAKVKLEEKKYTDVIYQLRGQTFKNPKTHIEALTIEIMAMYEEKEWNIITGRIHNFKRKLRSAKGKVSKSILEGQHNFLKVVEKLIASHYKKVEINYSIYKFLSHRLWLESHLKRQGILD